MTLKALITIGTFLLRVLWNNDLLADFSVLCESDSKWSPLRVMGGE